MKTNNQLVVLSGILVLLATATIAATYNVQTVECKFTKGTNNFWTDGGFTSKPSDSQNNQTGEATALDDQRADDHSYSLWRSSFKYCKSE